MTAKVIDWKNIRPESKTLHDFKCFSCGKVHRRYLSFREFNKVQFCTCGGRLDSGLDETTMARIDALSNQSPEIEIFKLLERVGFLGGMDG